MTLSEARKFAISDQWLIKNAQTSTGRTYEFLWLSHVTAAFSAAARMLSVNHATIARRLHSLEESLGEKLVERRPEGYVLTPAGIYALDAATDMEHAAQILGRGMTDGTPSGLVRINASPGLTAGFLVSRLPVIAARYPRLDIDLAPALRSISLERHEADIAIRFDKPNDGDVIARPLSVVGYGFYGTEEACASVEAGGEPVFISFNEADAYLSSATWLAKHFPRARIAFRAKDQFFNRSRRAQGSVWLWYHISSGVLIRSCAHAIWAPYNQTRRCFLVTRSRDRKSSSIRTVADEVARC